MKYKMKTFSIIIVIFFILLSIFYLYKYFDEVPEDFWLKTGKWSPDGSEALIVGYSDPYTVIMRYNGSEFEKLRLVQGFRLWNVYWSPDSSKAFILGEKLFLYEKGEITEINANKDIGAIYWSPNSQQALMAVSPQIKLGAHHQKLMRFDGELLHELIDDAGRISTIDWSFDGNEAIILSDNYQYIYRNDNISNLSVRALEASWNPSSNFALLSSSEGVIKYNQYGTQIISTNITFTEVYWNPNGTEALLVHRRNSPSDIEWYVFRNDSIIHISDVFHSLLPIGNGSILTIPDVSWSQDMAIISLYFKEHWYDSIEDARSYILKYQNNHISLITTHFVEYKNIVWCPDGSQALIIGEYWENDSWNPIISKYYNNNVDNIPLSKKGRLFDISWNEEHGALVVGGPTIVYKYKDNQLIDLSDQFKNAL